jgi:hypothetical protein
MLSQSLARSKVAAAAMKVCIYLDTALVRSFSNSINIYLSAQVQQEPLRF